MAQRIIPAVSPPPPVLDPGEDLPAPPQQKRSIAARQRLLDAARHLFAHQGFHATSIQSIAAQAGSATGAFYLYFRSKRQLLVVLMNDFLARLHRLDLRPQSAAAADPQTGLRQFLAAAFRADRDYYGVVRAWHEAALTDPALGQMQSAIETWTNARVLAVFRQLTRHPLARPDPDLPAFARMMDRHFWSILARASALSPRDLDREVRIAADVVYRYLFRDAKPPATPTR